MKAARVIALAVVLAVMPSISVAAEAARKVVSFMASVRVDVDANGKPMKVEAPADLPQEIRNYIEKRVTTWQYQPVKLHGVAVPATTYVNVAACAIPAPAGDSFRLAAEFDGNGPRYSGGKQILPPSYPIDAMIEGVEAEFVLILEIAANGKVGIGEIEKSDISRGGRPREFVEVLRHWAKTLRFDPELLAGSPVAGRVRMPVSFFVRDPMTRKALIEELQAKASASRECQMAAGANDMKPVAMDSVLKITPIPAS